MGNVLIVQPLTRSFHVDVNEAAVAFCLDDAMITSEHLIELRC